MNKVTLVGRLGQDPETRTSNSGKTFTKFSLATNDGYGENKKTNWHSCVAFGKSAEIIDKYVTKGSGIAVSGTLDYNKHDDKYYTSILVNEFTLIGGKNVSNSQSSNTPQAPPFETVSDLNDGDFDDVPF